MTRDMSGASAEPEEEEWEAPCDDEWVYLDDEGNVQGPFTTKLMRAWVAAELLDQNRLVGSAGTHQSEWLPLATWPELGKVQRPETELPQDVRAKLTDQDVRALWEYLDDRKNTQGPFSTAKVIAWLRTGLLHSNRKVRQSRTHGVDGTIEFTPISATMPFSRILGDVIPSPPPRIGESTGEASNAMDIPSWFYTDVSGCEQGPFTSTHMKVWISSGCLPTSTLARHIREGIDERRAISQIALLSAPDSVVYSSQPLQRPDFKEYVVERNTNRAYGSSSGVSNNRAERHMSNYFDHDAYQVQMNRASTERAQIVTRRGR